MDRIELDEELDSEQYAKKPIKALNFDISRLKVKKLSNPDHAKKTALAAEISQLWGKPIPRLMRLIKNHTYQDIFDAFEQTKKAEDVYNPWGLFLWKLKNSPGKK